MDLRRLSAVLEAQSSRERDLPNAQLQTSFKQAALSITSLFKLSQQATGTAYDNGYNQ
jgi:hypothetical protein